MSPAPPLTIGERAQSIAARAVFGLPRPLRRRLAGPPRSADGYRLDPEMQLLLRVLELNPRDELDASTPAESRKHLYDSARVGCGHPPACARVTDTELAGGEGRLRARLYEPAEALGQVTPLVVYYHGGGWVAGDLDTHDGPCRILANASGARVVSVDYRRSPEAAFPAPIDDALAAFRDAAARAREFSIEADRIAVAGDSAGGHLSAVVSQLAAADGGPAPALQVPIYPVTDCLNIAESRVKFAEGYVLTKQTMEWYESQLLAKGGERSDPRVSPLLADDLSGVAPALIVSAGFDILRDEDHAYAARLEQSGVRTILRCYEGLTHGFVNMIGLWSGPREALAEIGGIVRAELARGV